ncbi:MAG: hypothetical protein LH468_08175 [Nocardioides sp.]|nr:hypothetical protein [Nocardioides sp.]
MPRPLRRPHPRARRPGGHRGGAGRRAAHPAPGAGLGAPGSGTLTVAAHDEPVRLLVLGGPPCGEAIVMWWNFVGRSHEKSSRPASAGRPRWKLRRAGRRLVRRAGG